MDEWRAATDAVAIDCYKPAPTTVQAAETTHVGAPTGIITARQTAMMSRHSLHRLTVHHFSPLPHQLVYCSLEYSSMSGGLSGILPWHDRPTPATAVKLGH